MIAFLTFLVRQIVDHPDEITVSEEQLGERSFQYIIHAQSEDVGKIIGREGKIIYAIRNLAKILAVKENIQMRVEIA